VSWELPSYLVTPGEDLRVMLSRLSDKPDEYPIRLGRQEVTLGELRTFLVLAGAFGLLPRQEAWAA
jgi:hypothetical protein